MTNPENDAQTTTVDSNEENADTDLMSVEEALATFASSENTYQRAAVEAAIVRQEEITPHLLEIIDAVTESPEKFYGSASPIYALFLLAYFKETEAHHSIIKMFSLPNHHLEQIFGYITTEDLPMLLLVTSGGSTDAIKALARDQSVDLFVRVSALSALNYAVVRDMEDRENAIEFYRSLLESPARTESDSETLSLFTLSATALYPEELMPLIEEMDKEELLDPFIYDLEATKEKLEKGKEYALESVAEEADRYSIENIHGILSELVVYGEDFSLAKLRIKEAQKLVAEQEKQKKAKKKKKRKMARNSRKKNRR